MKTEVVPLFDLFHLCETAEKALSKELITNRGNLRGGIKKKKMALVEVKALVKAGHDWKLRIDHENRRANYNYRVTGKWSQKSLCTSYQAQGFVDLSH